MDTFITVVIYLLISFSASLSLLFLHGMHELGKPINFIISVCAWMIFCVIFQFVIFPLMKAW
jgi:hypothetical protein